MCYPIGAVHILTFSRIKSSLCHSLTPKLPLCHLNHGDPFLCEKEKNLSYRTVYFSRVKRRRAYVLFQTVIYRCARFHPDCFWHDLVITFYTSLALWKINKIYPTASATPWRENTHHPLRYIALKGFEQESIRWQPYNFPG